MRYISDVRLAEFVVNVAGKKNPQESRRVPFIEIRFKYTGPVIPRPVVPASKREMDTDDDASAPPVYNDDDIFDLPAPAFPGAPPVYNDDGVSDLPAPETHGSAPPSADLPMPDTDEGPSPFESDDPAEFPLASAFSNMPESGWEIRLRFSKPPATRRPTTWYWAAACGLLVGLTDYKPQGTPASVQARREWNLGTWIVSYGTYNTIIHSMGQGS